jgi:hypothetical protein
MKKIDTVGFIEKSKIKHGDYYNYDLVEYNGAHELVTIICPIHGNFSVKAYRHLQCGCKKCGNIASGIARKTSLVEFIQRANKIHENRYDYGTVAPFSTQHEKITIRCNLHGEFHQAANDHLKGSGCSACGRELIGAASRSRSIEKMLSSEEFVAKARRVHGDKYSYVPTIYRGSRYKVTIHCDDHGNFEQLPSNHLVGNNCPECAKDRRYVANVFITGSSSISLEEFVNRAIEVHGNKYDYVSYTSEFHVGIVCLDHGFFNQRKLDHLGGAGCPQCSRNRAAEELRITEREFLSRLMEKYENRVNLIGSYTGFSNRTLFTCVIHGDFESSPSNILTSRHGCSSCGIAVKGRSHTQETFEKRAKEIHGDIYTYGTFSRTSDKMEIICPIHGSFQQNAGNHLSGYSCPRCASKTVKQNRWLDLMNVSRENREIRIDINGNSFIVDGLAKDTVYEFWGDFWHGNPKRYDHSVINSVTKTTFGELHAKTESKRKLLLSKYKLVEIWESDWDKIYAKQNNRQG